VGIFRWEWAMIVFILSSIIGFQLRRLVPMQVHPASKHITFSFDFIYFALILLLVIAKVLTGQIPGLTIWTDVIMCMILGLMSGRLSGICLCVRDLKTQHFESHDNSKNNF
jgi:uncharacterized membrane-anchored protein YhcB (DUF1043 family)